MTTLYSIYMSPWGTSWNDGICSSASLFHMEMAGGNLLLRLQSLQLHLVALCPVWILVSSVHQDVSMSFRIQVVPIISIQALYRSCDLKFPSSPSINPHLRPLPDSLLSPVAILSFTLTVIQEEDEPTSATLRTTLPTIPFSFLPQPPSPSLF